MNRTALYGAECSFIIRKSLKTAPIYIYFNIIYINNLILYEVSDQPNISTFQFRVKTILFWLNTKSKVQKFFFWFYIYYIFLELLVYYQSVMDFFFLIYIFVTFLLYKLYLKKKKITVILS